MRRIGRTLACAGLCACTLEEEPVLDGIPPAWTQVEQRLSEVPQMGRVTIESGGAAEQWLTLDLSVGAIDSTAWIHQTTTGQSISINGYAPDDGMLTGVNLLTLEFDLASLTDERASVTTFAILGDRVNGLQRRDDGNADVTSWILTQPTDDTLQGRLFATLGGRLCDAAHDTAPLDPASCEDVQVTIETDIDFREF